MADTDDLAATLRAFFAGRPEVRLALLFGSRARGVEREGSDVAVAVAADPFDRLALMRDLAAATGLTVDVIDLDRAGYFLLVALLRDGIVVYEGRRHALAEWRTRAILETETDRPNFERMRDAFLRKTAEAARG
ncbi:MAG TPA: nucleotidyltransferase domain-containing protein [Thermoanaerobaculia bacterium]|nr:nucleotidyltransferase domain-containing protein [Thermoanaerobaculia bacterium]